MYKIKYAVSNELSQGFGSYLTGLFFFLTGISSGITCGVRAGATLGAGAGMGGFAALFLSAAPFVLMVLCAPFLLGCAGICAVLLWQGLLFGCGPTLPAAILQTVVCVPAALYMFRKSLGVSMKWLRIKRANTGMRLNAASELFPAALLCALICFLSRLPAVL